MRIFIGCFALIATVNAVAQSVVINEFRNASPDIVELLVIQDGLDMRGMILKDYSSSGGNDNGGGYSFTSNALWSSLPAGTIIVLRKDDSAADTTVGSGDYNLDVGLSNLTYFAAESGTFDIATHEIVQIKGAGSGRTGTVGAIHTFASGNAGTNTFFVSSPSPKLRTVSGDSGFNESAEALTPNQALADYDGNNALGDRAAGSIGTWNNANNQAFILTLRGGGPATTVQFGVSGDVVSEGSGTYTVLVYKTQPSGNVSASLSIGGTATLGSGNDYTISTTNFSLIGAVTSIAIEITINDDSIVESSETVVLTITNVTGATVGTPSTFTLTINDNDFAPPPAGEPWINEFNYDPPGTDSNEFVELAGPAGLDLSNYLLVLYNGSGNMPYSNVFCSGTIPDEGCGFGAVAFDTPNLQNGAPDGIALAKVVGGTTTLVQFISYEGPMTGSGGPADGVTSQNVGTQNGISDTLQLAGAGTNYAAFTWVTGTVSRGILNVGQNIVPCGGGPATNVYFALASASIGEAGGAYTVAVFKTQPSGNLSGSIALSGTATLGSGNDYTIDSTNFSLIGTTTSAFFVITINNDALVETNETVILTLTNVVGGGIGSPATFTLTITDDDTFGPAPSLNVWINELHYDNNGVDVDEGVEIAGPAGVNLTGYSLWLYDGGGACFCHYASTNLSGVIPDQSNGFGTLWFAISNIQNGPDGIALVYGATQVLQFISYEGFFTVTNGPAAGLTSTDIGVAQPTTGPVGHSLQLCGSGTNYGAFSWSTNRPHSRGLLNDCQTIPAGSSYSPAQTAYIVAYWGSVGSYTGDQADDDGDGFSNLEEFIAGTVPVPPGGATNFLRSIAITNAASRFIVTPSVTGRLYRLWAAQQLTGTQLWTSIAGPVAGTGGNISLPDGVVTNFRAYRVSVELENP